MPQDWINIGFLSLFFIVQDWVSEKLSHFSPNWYQSHIQGQGIAAVQDIQKAKSFTTSACLIFQGSFLASYCLENLVPKLYHPAFDLYFNILISISYFDYSTIRFRSRIQFLVVKLLKLVESVIFVLFCFVLGCVHLTYLYYESWIEKYSNHVWVLIDVFVKERMNGIDNSHDHWFVLYKNSRILIF